MDELTGTEAENLEIELLMFMRWLAMEDTTVFNDTKAAVAQYMKERMDPNKKPCGCDRYDPDPHGLACLLDE